MGSLHRTLVINTTPKHQLRRGDRSLCLSPANITASFSYWLKYTILTHSRNVFIEIIVFLSFIPSRLIYCMRSAGGGEEGAEKSSTTEYRLFTLSLRSQLPHATGYCRCQSIFATSPSLSACFNWTHVTMWK